ncbi:nitroreductase/quinone reductase family protein [Mycobacterium sp. ML3]
MHAAMYRWSRGKAQNPKYPTMLLTVTGRRTGRQHTVPLIYIKEGENFVIAAAYAGSDTDPAWWLNLQRNPRAVAQVHDERFVVEAKPVAADRRPELWHRLVEMYPYFTDYQQRTSRQIPVVVLTPASDVAPGG